MKDGLNFQSACDLIVTNGYLITVDDGRRVFARGAVAILGRTIVAVGAADEVMRLWRATTVIDARGAVVHPGFIDAHNHIVHTTCRGILDRPHPAGQLVNFADWKADVTSDDEHVATMQSCLELLRHGFTMFVEPGTVFDNDAVAAAAECLGVRGMLAGCYLWDQIEIMQHLGSLESEALYRRAPSSLERCLNGIGAELHRNRDPDALVRGFVSVYGLGTASDTLLKAAHDLAKRSGVVFQQHEGYLPDASRADRERLGKSRIRHLADLGILDSVSSLIHMYVMDDEELDLLANSGTCVVWCPAAYLQLGIIKQAPTRHAELRDRGGYVAVATDGALNSVIGDAGACAYWVAASVGWPITPATVIEMQTIDAARSAGRAADLGSIEVGKRADIVVRNTSTSDTSPGVNPIHQLALTSRGGTTDTVIVDGRIVMKHGRSVFADEERVMAEAQASVKRRMDRLGLTATAYW